MPTGTTGGTTPTTGATPTTGTTNEKWKPGPWILGTGSVLGICYMLSRLFGGADGTVDVNHHIDGGTDVNHKGQVEVPVDVNGAVESEVVVKADTASWNKVCRECQEEKQQKKTSGGKKNHGRSRSSNSNVNININNNNGEGTQNVCGEKPSGAGCTDGDGIDIKINNNNGGNQNVGNCGESAQSKPVYVREVSFGGVVRVPCNSH